MVLTRTDETTSCLAEWSSRGPRYTSYPPATEFGPVPEARVLRELQTIGETSEPVALYVHVPFCRSLCWYCGCNVIPTRDLARGIDYVDQLTTEMALIAGSLRSAPVTELALGGGSPNFLMPKTLRTLIGAVDRYFSVAPDARRSIELDPRSTTSAQLETLTDLGFRALSMGVQDFAEPVQDAIHRHQSVVQTRWLVERARMGGFTDINIDIVYGLPRQTEQSFATTLDHVLALEPDRVALFGYAHLPSKIPHQHLVERAGRVLDSYERSGLLLLAIEKFDKAGYVHLGLDHFARPDSALAKASRAGTMVRTFQGYVEHRADAIIGVGTSAISSTPRMHWQNHPTLQAWELAISERRVPVERGFLLDDDDRVRAALINRLMCDGSLDLARIGREHQLEPETYFASELAAIAKLPELATHDTATRTITATPIGRLLVRNLCMVFDRYHQQPTPELQRYSSTI
ncbi:MAG: oxygen-independent coproporphyrinogen oxidase [Deltaproteobacteria bacterium]|nr:oxygen-independent coproporphyrinogen oxidase [Deltaproteobacteria bacterium]